MQKITLKTVLDQMNARFEEMDVKWDKRLNGLDSKWDDRFQFMKQEFQRVEGKVDAGFQEVKKNLRTIEIQTAHITERVVALEAKDQRPA